MPQHPSKGAGQARGGGKQVLDRASSAEQLDIVQRCIAQVSKKAGEQSARKICVRGLERRGIIRETEDGWVQLAKPRRAKGAGNPQQAMGQRS